MPHEFTGLWIALGLAASGTLLTLLLALLMRASGASPRPAFWFGGLFALVLLPQLAGHAWLATRAAPDTPWPAAGAPGFGPDADRALVSDLRRVPGGAFAAAEEARLALLPGGESVLLARYAEAPQARQASRTLLQGLGVDGEAGAGRFVSRAAGDRALLLQSGRWVGLWTAPDDAGIRRRLAAAGIRPPAGGLLLQELPRTPAAIAAMALGGTLLLLLYVLCFFKGAAWAGSVPARPGVPALPAAALRARLLAASGAGVPWRVEAGATPDELLVTWRHADAAWADAAGAHRLTRRFRMRLRLDEAGRCVRATDQVRASEASAGAGGLERAWHASLGIVFFQRHVQVAVGLAIDDDGRFVPQAGHAWRFDVNEMRAPLVLAVTRAGWRWRPTVWMGPRWLRWLTE